MGLNVLNWLHLSKKKNASGWSGLGLPALLAHCLCQCEVSHLIKLYYSYLFSLLIKNWIGANAICLTLSNLSSNSLLRYWNVTKGHGVFNSIVLCVCGCVFQRWIRGRKDRKHQTAASVPVGDEPELCRGSFIREKYSSGAGHRTEQVQK